MLRSFLPVPSSSDFQLQNLPWGVFSSKSTDGRKHTGVAIGSYILDVTEIQKKGLFSGPHMSQASACTCFAEGSLNGFMSLGKPWWTEARHTLQRLLSDTEGLLRDDKDLQSQVLVPQDEATMHVPARIGDYTDFYVSRYHAHNVGALFRGPGQELQPNWLHLPVGYHGRASSIIVSGQDVARPRGQVKPANSTAPEFGPSRAFDFELEMGAFIGPGNSMGQPITIDTAQDHLFGMVLLNDWSARDIQAWEYVPLGPFNGKNFATQISPWIVTMDALEPFMTEAPKQDPEVLPYLRHSSHPVNPTFDIQLTADIIPAGTQKAARVTHTNFKHMYWTLEQMVAHHTAGGCNLQPGDVLGTGTISGPQPLNQACLLERTKGGKVPLELQLHLQGALDNIPGIAEASGSGATGGGGGGDGDGDGDGDTVTRTYLHDGDTIVFRGWCEKEGVPYKIGFGECRGTLLPCPEYK